MASCSKKETAATPEEKPAETPVVAPVEKPEVIEKKEVVLTQVASDLKGHVYALEADKYVSAEVSSDAEYYLIYVSASW